MKTIKGGRCVLVYECAGFGLILLLSIFNNLLDLSRLLVGGEGSVSRWRYGMLETVVILLIWAFVFSITRRLVRTIHHLKGMLRVCAWCRKIGHGDRWISLEAYFAEDFNIGTTHGICPECRKKLEEDTRHFRKEGLTAVSPLTARTAQSEVGEPEARVSDRLAS